MNEKFFHTDKDPNLYEDFRSDAGKNKREDCVIKKVVKLKEEITIRYEKVFRKKINLDKKEMFLSMS